jgi:transcriptional regulator
VPPCGIFFTISQTTDQNIYALYDIFTGHYSAHCPMYIPKYYEEKDWNEIEQLIKEHGFAILVGIKDGLPIASHIPLGLSQSQTGNWLLVGHVSKANALWKTFANDKEVLAIFMGPHAYVSPSWYNHKNVPTWNYKAVHVYGKASILDGEKRNAALSKMMDRYEQLHAEHPAKMSGFAEDELQKDLNGLVAFEIKIERIEAASKLSQNRDAESYQSVIDHLKKSDAYDSKQIAEEMEKRKK